MVFTLLKTYNFYDKGKMDVKVTKGILRMILLVLYIFELNIVISQDPSSNSPSPSQNPISFQYYSKIPHPHVDRFKRTKNFIGYTVHRIVHCVFQCESLCSKLQPIPIYIGCYTSCLPIKCARQFRSHRLDHTYVLLINYSCVLGCTTSKFKHGN